MMKGKSTCIESDCDAFQKARSLILLEEDIDKMEEELSARYYQLGKCIYEIADCKGKEINSLVDRLVEAKLKLVSIKEQQICLICMAQNPKENAYCGKCGKILRRDSDE